MGLFQKAIETYDAMSHLIGVYEANKEPLAPIGHIITRANIEITINREGEFESARKVDKDEPKIIIPVTEDSSSRSSTAIKPHALCDQLSYLSDSDKKTKYLEQLERWAAFTSNEKIKAIYQYVKDGNIIDDLETADVLKKDDAGAIKNKKDLICWRVIGTDSDDSAVWTDKELHKEHIQVINKHLKGEKSISYISGMIDHATEYHLKGVVSFNGNAKLISSNDNTNFTYRGRFLNSEEALNIGYTDSQKAHNALKRVIANQGVSIGNRTFVCWNPQGITLPKMTLPVPIEQDAKVVSPSEYKTQLIKTINGYKTNMPENADVVIASFEAATSGRLAITYFNNLQGSDFLERLRYWDETCCWHDTRWGTQSPSLRQIIKYAFGVQRGTGDSAKVEVDDNIKGSQIQRLIACRLDKAAFPDDIMRILVQKASRPECYNKKNRSEITFIACATIRKYYMDRYKEDIKMMLDPDRKDRSYQFGRLHAVLEKIERDTYDKDETRDPTAIRMQSVFEQRPLYAAKIINNQLKTAYYPKLKPGQKTYYEKLIGEIMQNIEDSEVDKLNNPLKETYLIGYYLQKNALYSNKKEDATNE